MMMILMMMVMWWWRWWRWRMHDVTSANGSSYVIVCYVVILWPLYVLRWTMASRTSDGRWWMAISLAFAKHLRYKRPDLVAVILIAGWREVWGFSWSGISWHFAFRTVLIFSQRFGVRSCWNGITMMMMTMMYHSPQVATCWPSEFEMIQEQFNWRREGYNLQQVPVV